MLHEHHRERLEETIEACKNPITAFELLPVLFRRKLDSHQIFFAMGEAIAHLNFLWHDKRLVRNVGDDQSIKFHN